MPSRSSDAEVQTFRFARAGHVYDVRDGRYLGYTNEVSAAVPYSGASLWSVLPYRVQSLRMDLNGPVAKGGDIEADIEAVAAGGACGTHVFHVDVIPPSGERPFHFLRNVMAPGGRVRFAFRIARNDPSGEWTLRAWDPLSGRLAERRFVVGDGTGMPPRVAIVLPNPIWQMRKP